MRYQEFVQPTVGDVLEIEVNGTVIETVIADVGHLAIICETSNAQALALLEDDDSNPVFNSITRRITLSHPELLGKYGLDKVLDAIEQVSYDVGEVEEIGTSDVSAWVKQVINSLARNASRDPDMAEGFVMNPANPLSPVSLPNTLNMLGGSPSLSGLGSAILIAAGILGVSADPLIRHIKDMFRHPQNATTSEILTVTQQIKDLYDKTQTLTSPQEKQKAQEELKKAYEILNQLKAKVKSGVREGQDDELYGLRRGMTVKITDGKFEGAQGDVIDIFPEDMEVELLLRGPHAGRTALVHVHDTQAIDEIDGSLKGVAEGSDLDQQARDVADTLTSEKNLEKLRGMAHDSTVYRALDRYFAKNNLPENIYNRVAHIVFNKLNKQGVAEGSVNDYFKRRKDEEGRISGTKSPAKRTPQQTDYAKRRAQEKKVERGVAESAAGSDIVTMVDDELENGAAYEQAVIAVSSELDIDPREVDDIYRANSPDSDNIPPINFGDTEQEDDGQPSTYDEYQDLHGGDDWDHGQYDNDMYEAEYHGRKVKLGKPMQGDVKKFKVYVRDPKTGRVKKVNFGDPNMRIKKSNPKRRKSFRARHRCDNPGPRTKARFWSCKKW